jgi:hypothetical protein
MIKDILKLNKMRKVIRLDNKEEKEKPVKLFAFYEPDTDKWRECNDNPSIWDNVFFRETIEGLDYFICWNNGHREVIQYRGHLNSGKF